MRGRLAYTRIVFSFSGSDPGEADNQSTCGDVQKKVIPWKDAVPEVDLEPALRGRGAALGRPDGGLIVVASLIDKAANLGGKAAGPPGLASQLSVLKAPCSPLPAGAVSAPHVAAFGISGGR